MLIKILYVLLILCTAALVAVGVGVVLRVRRHLKPGHPEGHGAQGPGDDPKSTDKGESS